MSEYNSRREDGDIIEPENKALVGDSTSGSREITSSATPTQTQVPDKMIPQKNVPEEQTSQTTRFPCLTCQDSGCNAPSPSSDGVVQQCRSRRPRTGYYGETGTTGTVTNHRPTSIRTYRGVQYIGPGGAGSYPSDALPDGESTAEQPVIRLVDRFPDEAELEPKKVHRRKSNAETCRQQ